MKIAFIGHPGSGKTYAAGSLSEKLGMEKIVLDKIFDDDRRSFVLTKRYRENLQKLLSGKNDWILDGYHGRHMPDWVWKTADMVIFIDLPKKELINNFYGRYKQKKQDNDPAHWQNKYLNNVKNYAQITLRDRSLHKTAKKVRSMKQLDKQFVHIRSRIELDTLLNNPAAFL